MATECHLYPVEFKYKDIQQQSLFQAQTPIIQGVIVLKKDNAAIFPNQEFLK